MAAAASSEQKKTTALVAVACVAALAGLGVWARSQQRKRLVTQRKQLTGLRFDLSVAEIEAETARIIARMQQVDDEVAAASAASVTFANTAQKLIDLDCEMLSRVTNVTFLGHVSAVKEIRDACNKADEAITDFSVKRGMRADVYKALLAFASTAAFKVRVYVEGYRWAGCVLAKRQLTAEWLSLSCVWMSLSLYAPSRSCRLCSSAT